MTQLLENQSTLPDTLYTTGSHTTTKSNRFPHWLALGLQILRFSFVGGLNTLIDLLLFNSLLFLHPTKETALLLAYNTVAYTLGSLNSFLLNKYWTFRHQQKITTRELYRFILTTILGLACSNAVVWLTSSILHSFINDTRLLANASKLMSLMITTLISYASMKLWVFAKK